MCQVTSQHCDTPLCYLNCFPFSLLGRYCGSGKSRREDRCDRDGGCQHCVVHTGRRPHWVWHRCWWRGLWQVSRCDYCPSGLPTPRRVSGSESQRQPGEQNRPDVLLSGSFLELFLRVSSELPGQLGRIISSAWLIWTPPKWCFLFGCRDWPPSVWRSSSWTLQCSIELTWSQASHLSEVLKGLKSDNNLKYSLLLAIGSHVISCSSNVLYLSAGCQEFLTESGIVVAVDCSSGGPSVLFCGASIRTIRPVANTVTTAATGAAVGSPSASFGSVSVKTLN